MRISVRTHKGAVLIRRDRGKTAPHSTRWEQQMTELENSLANNAEEAISAAGLGQKIRQLRLKRSMGLVELGRRTGLSASFLSQLETGRVVPTLRNLSRIALVFQKDLSFFFQTRYRSCFRISRGNRRSRIRMKAGSGAMISESMSLLIPDRSLVPCVAEFSLSEENSSFFPEVFDGEEFAYVLSGSVTFFSESREETLEAADVLWVCGETAREYRCRAGQNAKVMIITRPSGKANRTLRAAASVPF
jgi:transcriptional regulator with XRE-family HTH domain